MSRQINFRPRLELLEERALLAVFTVLNVDNSGSGSLRWAIEQANSNPGHDAIAFNIDGGGAKTISLTSALPTIADSVTIDATTQPGYAGAPLIELTKGTSSQFSGLTISAGNSIVRGLAVNGFNSRPGIVLTSGGGNRLESNYIGVDLSGTLARPNGFGIVVTNSAGNVVGGDGETDRNVVSGNSTGGILLTGSLSMGNVVQGNYVGTDASGHLGITYAGVGIRIDGGAGGNRIGGTAAAARNVISANDHGVSLIYSGSSNQVQGNYIGTTADGTAALGNLYHGVRLEHSADNLIGGTVPGAGNVIAGSTRVGVYIEGTGSANNRFQGNRIGTNADGTAALGNAQGISIAIGASGNQIGGTALGAGNLISGNNGYGISINDAFGVASHHNVIQGNLIGLNVDGTAALVNQGAGVEIVGAFNNLVGGDLSGARNVISGNALQAIRVAGPAAMGNRIQGNYVGTNAAGNAAIGNGTSGANGIQISNAPGNLIGGDTPGAGNIVAASFFAGINISGSAATGNQVMGNLVGTNASGSAALGNGHTGIWITSGNNFIGGATPAARNLISGNGHQGVAILGTGAHGNQVQGNFIGTDISGTLRLPNLRNGIWLEGTGSTNNTIGGSLPGEGNLISGNNQNGVVLIGSANNNDIVGNLIGTNAAGTQSLHNGHDGVHLFNAHDNQIGGTAAGERNVIASNQRNGIWLLGTSVNNRVQGNFIGTNSSGDAALGNRGGSGIRIESPQNIIGGTEAGAGNVIAATTGAFAAGVRLVGLGATLNTIQGNRIGTDRTGMHPLPNALDGVRVDNAPANQIGGSEPGAGNLISGNGRIGIFVLEAGAVENVVQGNTIGIDAAGGPLGNTTNGVQFGNGASFNVLGADADGIDDATEGNVIAFNTGLGVTTTTHATLTALGNSIRANSIHSNGGLGIDLGNNGVTANDIGDIDTGPNNYQNFPVLASAQPGMTTRVIGTLNSRPDATYLLDFYANTTADPSGHGPGERWLGFATVTTDTNGDTAFDVQLTAQAVEGEFITATATDADGNTSEFSGSAIADFAPPHAEIHGDTSGPEGTAVVLTSTVTSVSAAIQQAGFTYEWTVTHSRDNGQSFQLYATGNQSSLTLDPDDDGLYRVELLATDSANQTSQPAVHEIAIDNAVPTATLSSSGPFTYGVTVTVSLGDPQDPSTADTDAGFRYAFALNASELSSDYASSSEIESQSFLLDAGTHTVYARIFDKDGGFSEYSTEVMVTPAPLTVTVHDATKVVGESNPPFTVSYDGFVLGQDETYLVGELAFQTDADETSAAGNYEIHASGWESGNYAIQYVPGNLAVTALAASVDIRPESLNLAQNGMISVVIFGSEGFDATSVHWQSVRFNFSDAVDAVFASKHSFTDVDGDGNLDMVLHFDMNQLRDSLLQVYRNYLQADYDQNDELDSAFQQAELSLSGEFGEHDLDFEGSDSVRLFLAGKALREFLASMELAN